MEQNRKKYILLQDRIGSKIHWGLLRNSRTDIQALKGELFEALPEAQQPRNGQHIALAGIDRTELHLECSATDLARLSDKEADLLLAVASLSNRHTIYHDRKRLDAGKQLKESSKVWVKVKGVRRELPGVVWYSGPLEIYRGTMFGVELKESGQGQGETDGMFRNKRYFHCPPDSGVFVSLDKLTPREDEVKGTFTALKEKMVECAPAVIQGRTAGKKKKHKRELDFSSLLEVDQKVFVFLQDGEQVKGSVRYFGGEKDKKGRWYILVGVELEERLGHGNGMFNGKQFFVCKSGFAIFVTADSVIPVDQMMDDSQGRRQEGIGNKVRTQEDLHQYGTRYQEKLRAEPDRGPRSLSYIEINQGKPRGTQHSYPLRRSRSSASSAEDLDVIKSAHLGIHPDGSNKDEIIDEQRRILDEIHKEKYGDIAVISKPEAVQSLKGRQLEELREELAAVRIERDGQREEFRSLTQVKNTQERDLEEVRRELIEVTNAKEAQLQELNGEIAVLTNERDEQREELRSLTQVNSAKERELEEVRRELIEVTNAKEAQLQELNGEIAVLTNERDEQREELRSQTQENSAKERELEEVRRELIEVTNANEARLEETREEMAQVANNNENLRTELSELLNERTRSQQEIERLQQERDELRNRAVALADDWTVDRDEIDLTDTHLGTGGWASVKVGVFRGMKVAVKQIHDLILSDFNRGLFAREMRMAARFRHPCLLQFIGATNEDGESPMLVTELMDKSLRSLLEERGLADEEVVTIALDVTKALNYLHLNQPAPIIHRDISSANVLLWKRRDCWRGKVSDYGTANFMHQVNTSNPGAPLYVAPEASDVARQSPKMDVYSFGVLLCEMSIRELPDPQRRLNQIDRVRDRQLRDLVTRCVCRVPQNRPDMADVLRELEALES